MRIEIQAESRGQRLDKFVADQLQLSRAASARRLEGATLDGAPTKASQTLRGGEVLVLPEQALVEPTAPPQVLAREVSLPPILWEDDDLLVINKPRGLVIHAGAGETGATLVDVLRAHGRSLSALGPAERAGIVHRLDKDTTGVMVVAKSNRAHEAIAREFEQRTVQKTYLALVCGVPRSPGRIEAPIARHEGNRLKMAVAPHGKSATTLYRVKQTWPQPAPGAPPKMALCEVDLLTGRTHQIRVHLAFLGHPVVGDELYGGQKRGLEAAPTEDVRAALQAMGGQALHAWTLGFEHPVSGEPLRFEAPLPEDFQAVLDTLGEPRSQ